jgi:hypothetical protein
MAFLFLAEAAQSITKKRQTSYFLALERIFPERKSKRRRDSSPALAMTAQDRLLVAFVCDGSATRMMAQRWCFSAAVKWSVSHITFVKKFRNCLNSADACS